MSEFVKHFSDLIAGQFGNRVRFAEVTGASTPYLSEIFNKGKLPTVTKLREWLEKADVPTEKANALLILCSAEKAAEDPDLQPWLGMLDTQHKQTKATILALIKLCRDGGLKVPKELEDRVRAL